MVLLWLEMIGMGSIVAAGSIVTCDIPPCEIWAGVPAKKLKDRFASEADKRKHLEFLESLHLSKNMEKRRNDRGVKCKYMEG